MKTTSAAVSILEQLWHSIQRHHLEVPAVQLILASGEDGRGVLEKYGHYAHLRWHNEGQVVPEVLLAGEALTRKPEEILEVLLHEAAHALAVVRQIKDTSRQGRYHNKAYAVLALELGLGARVMGAYGYTDTYCLPETVERYAAEIALIGSELRKLYRVSRKSQGNAGAELGAEGADQAETEGEGEKKKGGMLKAVCHCEKPRVIRIARSVFELGPIGCLLCMQPFELEESEGG